MDKYKLKAQSKKLQPVLQLGKEGLTETMVTEIKRQLRQKKLIKIRMLRSLSDTADKKEVAKELAEKTDSILIDHIGFTYVLALKSFVDTK